MNDITFHQSWRKAPLPLQVYGLFLLGLGIYEIANASWVRFDLMQLPSLRYTLEVGYLYSVPLVHFAIRNRWRRAGRALVAVLSIQTLYAATIYFMNPSGPLEAIVWTVVSSFFWIGMLCSPSVRRYWSEEASKESAFG